MLDAPAVAPAVPAHKPGTFNLSYDGARPSDFLSAALSPIAHSAWVLIRYERERRIAEVITQPGIAAAGGLEELVRAEHALHVLDREPMAVERSRAPLAPYRHGLTMLCGDDDGIRALIVLVRDESGERFSEAEVRLASEILGPIATYLARRRDGTLTAPPEQVRTRSQPAFYVLSADHQIEFGWCPEGMPALSIESAGPGSPLRLDPRIEATVRELTADWDFAAPASLVDGVAVPMSSYVLRVVPLQGVGGGRIGVTLERFKTRNAIRAAAQGYGLSRREIDVLGLLIEGRENKEVAEILRIAASTVNDHVKRMLVKTQSRNRAELVARVLGWNAGN